MTKVKSCMIAIAVLAIAGTTFADDYKTRVIAKNLSRPTGITADAYGRLFFTELPTPGVGGKAGGTNTVNQLNVKNGRIRNLTTGEPEPTNLSVNFFGDLYWTCKSAGLILTLEEGAAAPELVASGLNKPSGIAAYPFGLALFFTEVPTPGVSGPNGGMNAVYGFLEGIDIEFLLDFGDPEPTDVAVDLCGTVYWTCTSAGVIVKMCDGKVDVIARGLEKPTGIALDFDGNLYFTEVPTPGKSGAMGGRNKVSKMELDTGKITVINKGDPDPIDVTVVPFGTTVYWTCRSAGVIVEAKLRR